MPRKKFKDTRFFKFFKNLVVNKLQTLPVIGTIITNAKEATPENPKGEVHLTGWDWFRIVIGIAIGIILYRGVMTMDDITDIFDFVSGL